MSTRVKVARVVFASEDFFQEESSRVFVELWELGEHSHRTSNARLTANPQVLELYEHWRTAYRNFYRHLSLRDDFDPRGAANRTREEELGRLTQLKLELENCSINLIEQFNHWLSNQVSFRDGVENWLGDRFNLDDDEIRIAIESDDPNVRRLPWQAWRLLDRFERAELSIGDTRHDSSRRTPTNTRQNRNLKLLAVFGYEGGLNLDRDKNTIQALAHVEADFLHQPTLQELKAKLRQCQWDSLYFGGHSASDCEGKTGVLYLNSQEPIEISQLKGALKTAVRDGGLQLGIFNSCDGLGLVSQLEDVHFPLSIVMREPVPNEVAQRFLKSFLQAYTLGKPLYLALRQARLLLEDDSEELPYVSWLPAIAHDSSTNPLLWQDCEPGPPETIISLPLEPHPNSPVPQASHTPLVPKRLPVAEAIATFKPSTILGGSYEVIDELSRGSFSVTYLAKALDLPGQPNCTVKQLKPVDPRIDMGKASKLFEREAQMLFDLGSSTDRIPTLYASFAEGGEFYLVQEYIAGEELEKELRSRGRLSEGETLELLSNILEALQVIHQREIIHRDIKPSNLMRRKSDGKIVLIDFGAVKEVIASATYPEAEVIKGGTIVGSPGFMAPEQSIGFPQQASDIFSVGAIAFRAVTGKAPDQTLSAEGKTGRLIRQDSQRLSDEMEALLNQMVHAECEQRFSNADEALQAVKQLQSLRELREPRNRGRSFGQFISRSIQNFIGTLSGRNSHNKSEREIEVPAKASQKTSLGNRSKDDSVKKSVTESHSETKLSQRSDRASDGESSFSERTSPTGEPPFDPDSSSCHSTLPPKIYTQLENAINSLLGPIGSLVLDRALENTSTPSEAIYQIMLSLPAEAQNSFYVTATKLLSQLPSSVTERDKNPSDELSSLTPETKTVLQQSSPQTIPDRDIFPEVNGIGFPPSEFQKEEIRKYLVNYLGPMANIALKRAINSANSSQELISALLEWLPSNRHDLFRAFASNLLSPESGMDAYLHPTSLSKVEKPVDKVVESVGFEVEGRDRKFVDVCQTELSKHIGPIAAIAIRESLRNIAPGGDRESFLDNLTTYLPDSTASADFRRAVRNWHKK